MGFLWLIRVTNYLLTRMILQVEKINVNFIGIYPYELAPFNHYHGDFSGRCLKSPIPPCIFHRIKLVVSTQKKWSTIDNLPLIGVNIEENETSTNKLPHDCQLTQLCFCGYVAEIQNGRLASSELLSPLFLLGSWRFICPKLCVCLRVYIYIVIGMNWSPFNNNFRYVKNIHLHIYNSTRQVSCAIPKSMHVLRLQQQ